MKSKIKTAERLKNIKTRLEKKKQDDLHSIMLRVNSDLYDRILQAKKITGAKSIHALLIAALKEVFGEDGEEFPKRI